MVFQAATLRLRVLPAISPELSLRVTKNSLCLRPLDSTEAEPDERHTRNSYNRLSRASRLKPKQRSLHREGNGVGLLTYDFLRV